MHWLPPKLDFQKDFLGNWDEFLKRIYQIYIKDFKTYPRVIYKGKIIFTNENITDSSGKEEGFWHLVDRDDYRVDQRLPNIVRAEKIPWARAILENSHQLEVKCWKNIERKKRRNVQVHYFWLEAMDYVVIIQEFNKTHQVLTAHHIDHEHKRRKLREAYKRRVT